MFIISTSDSIYLQWKRCMLDNQYMGINIISSSLRCEHLYKKYKTLKAKEAKEDNQVLN